MSNTVFINNGSGLYSNCRTKWSSNSPCPAGGATQVPQPGDPEHNVAGTTRRCRIHGELRGIHWKIQRTWCILRVQVPASHVRMLMILILTAWPGAGLLYCLVVSGLESILGCPRRAQSVLVPAVPQRIKDMSGGGCSTSPAERMVKPTSKVTFICFSLMWYYGESRCWVSDGSPACTTSFLGSGWQVSPDDDSEKAQHWVGYRRCEAVDLMEMS